MANWPWPMLFAVQSFYLYIRRGRGKNILTTRASLSLASLLKLMPSALRKDAAKYLNQSWSIPSTIFIPAAVALQTKFSLFRKFSRNLGSMPKTPTHVLLSMKSIWPVPREKLCGVLREYGVDGRLLLAIKSLYSCSEVRVGGVKPQAWDAGVEEG